MDVWPCQLHVNLSPESTWYTFRSKSQVTSNRNFSAAFEYMPLIIPKPATLLFLRALKEQCRSWYQLIVH
jgi:hypothetical protein